MTLPGVPVIPTHSIMSILIGNRYKTVPGSLFPDYCFQGTIIRVFFGRQPIGKGEAIMGLPVVFMYSGQGAQYYQMGKELYEKEPVFSRTLNRCSDVVSPLIGTSLIDVIYGGKKTDPFERTLYTHPANVAFCYSLTQTLYARGIKPDMLLGYSLGEYVCALIAEALPMEKGLELIVRQARLLEEKTANATMMAVLDDPAIMQRRPQLFQGSWLSGHNFPNHFVITGYRDRLKAIENQLFEDGITAQILPISHGFHSPIIDPIREDNLQLLTGFTPPRLPCYSGMTTGPIESFSAEHIWNVVRNPVRFLETVRAMEAHGPFNYIDVGPAGTLATFVKYILGNGSSSQALISVNQFGRDLLGLERLKAGMS